MNPLFSSAQLGLIAPEMVLTLSAFLILGLSTVRDPGPKLWAPLLSILACIATLAALLAFITVGIFVQVLLRYLFSVAFIWGEEPESVMILLPSAGLSAVVKVSIEYGTRFPISVLTPATATK